ncbi:YdcF family protein [Gulosibacter chungangensis]|uniref:YdcF family protein n=1 Tax=Gulosibacter chungangensis TaxID=979746 RepID=A0A7J5B8R8_9MICO|nr:YdcF family protein [Gulosibacter chungangensis]KAB1641678.1 YdcF family protein [Gulosibacter chungangensis]
MNYQQLRNRTVIITGSILAAMFVVQLFIVFLPKTDAQKPVDVVVVLAPQTYRLHAGVDLIDAGYSDRLAISAPLIEYPGWLCAQDASVEIERPVTIVCFEPVPSTTQGEALSFAEVAEAHGWESAAVVTDRSHLNRTRMYFETCTSGIEYSFIMAERDRSVLGRVFSFFYETFAWYKAGAIGLCN